jgi:hypothetical protein
MKSLPMLLCSHDFAHLCSVNINDAEDMDLDRQENCKIIAQNGGQNCFIELLVESDQTRNQFNN